MNASDTGWKRRAEALFAPLAAVHGSWFPEALRRHGALLDAAAAGQAAGKLLRRYLPAGSGRIAARDNDSLPAWAAWDAASQRRLVLRLGAIACAAPIRRSIAKTDLDALRDVIGEAIYREAIAAAEPLVDTDLSEDYQRALSADRLGQFLTGIGLSVLLGTGRENLPFVSFRLRYLFPAAAWPARRTDLRCNEALVARLLQHESDD